MAPHQLPPGVRRGPDGKFVSGDGIEFADVEVVPWSASIFFDGHTIATNVQDYANQTAVEGIELVDMDEVIDRNERAHLLYTAAALRVQNLLNNGNDPVLVGAKFEVSSSPSRQVADLPLAGDMDEPDFDQIQGDMDSIGADVTRNDTLDLLVRPLVHIGSGAYANTNDGTGGGGGFDGDVAYGPLPGTEEFHTRDEIFLNGLAGQNGAFAGTIRAELAGAFSFGVESR